MLVFIFARNKFAVVDDAYLPRVGVDVVTAQEFFHGGNAFLFLSGEETEVESYTSRFIHVGAVGNNLRFLMTIAGAEVECADDLKGLGSLDIRMLRRHSVIGRSVAAE